MQITTLYTAQTLSARIARATRAAARHAASDMDAWHEIRRAFIRAVRRELGLPQHGLAPLAVFCAAEKYAHASYFMRGWASTFDAADAGARPTLRRLVRRARKGTLV